MQSNLGSRDVQRCRGTGYGSSRQKVFVNERALARVGSTVFVLEPVAFDELLPVVEPGRVPRSGSQRRLIEAWERLFRAGLGRAGRPPVVQRRSEFSEEWSDLVPALQLRISHDSERSSATGSASPRAVPAAAGLPCRRDAQRITVPRLTRGPLQLGTCKPALNARESRLGADMLARPSGAHGAPPAATGSHKHAEQSSAGSAGSKRDQPQSRSASPS